MKSKIISLLAIIFGLILIIFPTMGFIQTGAIIGLSVLLISIYLLISGIAIIDYNRTGSLLDLIFGIILLIISIFLIFNIQMLGFLTQITFYIAGIILIAVGVISLINNRQSRYSFYIGISGVLLGLLYIIIVAYITNPIILGSLIGLWLIISGVLKFMDG